MQILNVSNARIKEISAFYHSFPTLVKTVPIRIQLPGGNNVLRICSPDVLNLFDKLIH